MSRLFEYSEYRQQQLLNGFWRFQVDPEDRGEAEGWCHGLPAGDTVSVPSMWNNEQGLLQYEGAAWYQRELSTEGGTLRLCFDGVMTEATVWLDDMLIGSHYGGFCQFDCIARHVTAGTHRLTVRADNRFDEKSIPQKKVDWYHYGGISRDVRAETLKGICVLNDQLHYSLNSTRSGAKCYFVLELCNAEEHDVTTTLTARVGGQAVLSTTLTLGAGERSDWTSPDFDLEDIHLWDVNDPHLYDIEIVTDTDGLCDRTGFRAVEVTPAGILLNGRLLELRGVNRHEEHPDWGFAFPEKLMKKDLDIITDLGCNTIRGSHYPNAQGFVDMLDARGLLFWSEIPIWGCGFSQKALGDPDVVERGLEMHREMVRYYFNHPSIIIWGMHNEILCDTAEALEMSKVYYDYLKQHGGNRIVTYATHKPMEDICMAYCDIICINAYFGWYWKREDRDAWRTFLEDFRARRNALGFSGKPVIISEFGAAALYGHHTFDDIPWTEEYQAELLARCLELFHANPMVAGYYVWQFCDIRTHQMSLDRARGFNNKGILNEYRKPKAAYGAVKACYHRFAKEN